MSLGSVLDVRAVVQLSQHLLRAWLPKLACIKMRVLLLTGDAA